MSQLIPTMKYLQSDYFVKNGLIGYDLEKKKALLALQQWHKSSEENYQKTVHQKLSNLETLPDPLLNKIIVHTVDVEKLATATTLPDLYESIGALSQLSRVSKRCKSIADNLRNNALKKLLPFNESISTLWTQGQLNQTLKYIFLQKRESIYGDIKDELCPGGIFDTKKVLKRYKHLTADTFVQKDILGVFSHFREDMRNVDSIDNKGDTQLLFNCKEFAQFPYVAPIKFLLESGADPNKANSLNGRTPLMNIVSDGIPYRHGIPENEVSAGIAAAIKMAKLLLEYGADINTQDNDGKTALMLACVREGYIKTHDTYYQEAHRGTLVDNSAMIKFLLDRRANPNLQDKWGRTALRHVIESHGEFQNHVKLLLTYCADPNIKDSNEHHALDILNFDSDNRMYGDTEALKSILLDYGAKTKYGPKSRTSLKNKLKIEVLRGTRLMLLIGYSVAACKISDFVSKPILGGISTISKWLRNRQGS